ncbi:MAG: hypothetical protein QXK95_05610 [Nitrososphaerota archaeon]
MYLNKGQAEIIGGIIVLAVFISAIGLLYTTLMQLSSTSTKGFSERANFEAEKNIEKLTVDYDSTNKRCILVNQGPIPLAITRIWIGGKPIDVDPIQLKPAESISSIGEYGVDNIDMVVTNRGNVIEVKKTCEILKKSRPESTPSSSLFTSEDILNINRISKGLNQGYLYVNIIKISSKSSSSSIDRAVVYFNGSYWLCSSRNNDKKVFAESFSKISSRDMDGNRINEIIIIDIQKCSDISTPENVEEYSKYLDRGNVNYIFVNYIFQNLVYIPNRVDTVTIHFKLVMDIESGGESKELSLLPTVSIKGSGGVSISSPSTVSIASSRSGIVVVSGYAIFPIKAFNLNIAENEVYNMEINIEIKPPSGSSLNLKAVRLEYLAITGASIADPWRE